MNYKERIAALQSFKASVSSGSITEQVSTISSDISGWEGTSDTKFDDYISDVQSDCKTLSNKRASFLSEIDTLISGLENLFELEYNSNSYILGMTYDAKDVAKNRMLKRSAIDNLFVDESVKNALKSRV